MNGGFKSLVLCGGGTKCITMLGYLQHLMIDNKLNNLENISACSAGAYIAVLYILGIKPIKMLDLLPNENISIDIQHLLQLSDRKGLYRIKKFAKLFKKMVREKLGMKYPTMKDLYRYSGINLYIYTCNITTNSVEYINHLSHPDYPLLDVVYASSSIPIIFVPIRIGDNKYIDGGIVSSIPLHPVNNNDCIILNCINNKSENGLLDYILKLLNTGQQIRQKEDLTTFVGKYICINSNLGLLDFNTNTMNEFLHGWNQYHI
jgi:predicted acylesterase/phospholipase RssA